MALINFSWIKRFEKQYHEVPVNEADAAEDVSKAGDAETGNESEAGDAGNGNVSATGSRAADESASGDIEAGDGSVPGAAENGDTAAPEDGSASDAAESEEAAVVSSRGRVLSRMISYISTESSVGKSLKTGELRKKMQELGSLDSEGNVIKPYVIRDVDWIREQIEKAKKTGAAGQ